MSPDADARRKRIIRLSYSAVSAQDAGPWGDDGGPGGGLESDGLKGDGRSRVSSDAAAPESGVLSGACPVRAEDGRSLRELGGWLMPPPPGHCTELILFSSLTGESETVRFDSPLVVIGRDARCGLKLDHPDVSRKHACLHVLRDRILCVDLCSRTGVSWGGERRQSAWIEPGRPVGIGPYELRLPSDAASSPGEAAIDPDRFFSRCLVDGTGGSVLRVMTDAGDFLQEARIGRAITLIGRSSRCKLRLDDAGVSRVDSSLAVTPRGVWLTNLMGRGKVRINGERVSSARLSEGDELRVGRFRMRFVTDVAVGGRFDREAETLPPGGAEMFAEIRREMVEQFRLQTDLTVGLFEALKRDLTREIRSELFRLVEVGSEIRSARRRLAEPGGRVGERADARTTSGVGSEPAEPPSRNGAADHALITHRLRELENERGRRWRNLVALVGPGA